MPEPQQVTLADIERARDLLKGVAVTTPVERSRSLGELVGADVFLKCEHLQRTGSFKIRGAYVRIAGLTDDERARGVVAASAGNHAQGVALAASMLGAEATVFMPEGAPIPKEQATRGYGAHVRFAGTDVDGALIAAREFAAETGAVFIHPYDHPDVVAGQGTLGLELVAQVPAAATVLVPCGGGGLLAGVAIAVRALRPDVRVVGVQAAGAAAYPASLAAGEPVQVGQMSTMADGIAVGLPGEVPLAAVRREVDEMVTVGEESLSQALLLLLERAKQLVEPAGAAAVAALLDQPRRWPGPVVAVLSGGNVDPLLLLQVVRHGLAAAGRYLSFTVRVPDRPGELVRLLALLADAQANVLEVGHHRVSAQLHVDEVAVALQVETRGGEHRERVVARLREAGYPVAFA